MSHGISFGGFELRPVERVLLQADGTPAALGTRAFDVLLALLERRDRVVTKNELLDLAWPGLVVEENNLAVQISALRKVLGPQAIATIPGRGYRFAIACDAGPKAGSLSPNAAGRIVRRLATIAFADVAAWSRLVERSDVAAAQAWKATRSELIEPLVPTFGGRVIELTAEATLVEFSSAVDGVRWATDLQERLANRRLEGGNHPIRMRIGIGVEDVIVDEDKLVGDGVNLASRVKQFAAADEVVVTEAVRYFTWNKLPVQFQSLGERQLENESRSMSLHRVLTAGPDVMAQAHPHLMWENRPTVAVLPFSSEGSDVESYFGDGMTEEIVTLLSTNRSFFVVARNSTLRYRDRTLSTMGVAAELGVRYVLVGSVRRLASRLRISTELIDAGVDRVIWAEQYDGTDEDLFGFQDRIAASICAAIDPRVQEAEIARVRARPTDSVSAYDCVLRGLSIQYNFNEADFNAAGKMFRHAIEIDPYYAQAHAHLAWWYNLRIGEGRSSGVDEDGLLADRLSRRAVELDPRDAWALSVAGHIQSFLKKQFAAAMEMFDQALELNPSCAAAWARSATTLAYIGQGEQALVRVRNAMRLSPFDQQAFSFCTTNGTACIVAGRYDEAVSWLNKARRLNPRYKASFRMLIAALSLSGETAEAHALAEEFLMAEPEFRVSLFGAWYPMQPPHLHTVLEGMRMAGLPH